MIITPRAVRLAFAACLIGGAPALAGGSPENVLLIINPGSAESMYLGNYYKRARNIPDANVLYIDPGATNYAEFTASNGDLDGFFGALRGAGLTDHIDYVVIANTGTFFISAPGYITDGCSAVMRFSQNSVFTLAYMKSSILAGMPSTSVNQYSWTDPNAPRAFNARTGWIAGAPSQNPAAQRYFISASLGYTGDRGNTLPELIATIDRSVAADGSRPGGTFYYMSTPDQVRNVRAPGFPASEVAITSRGGAAVTINGILPDGHNDCLGVLTGWALPDILGSTMVLTPGSFADHLTSWAATFDMPDQTKISDWIRKGVSGSAGEVEEPCNYPGKFPNADLHAFYFQGLSLGEAYLRSLVYLPFQGLFIGDPLTRAFTTFPSVNASPPASASGRVSFTPSASTTLPGASILGVDLLIDGVFQSSHPAGQSFTINTGAIPDGWHELRLLAYDNSAARNTGRWVGSMTSNNFGRSVALNLNTASGDLNTLFDGMASATGGPVSELRLLHNGRVVAAAQSSPAHLQVYGRNLGAGMGRVQAEALYADGRTSRSAPVDLDIAYSAGTPSGQPPVAYSYSKRVPRGGSFVVELPARFDDGLSAAAYSIVTPPSAPGVTVGAETRSSRVMSAPANACGPDQFTFRVMTPSGSSNTATVTLIYGPGPVCPADVTGDGSLDINDFIIFQAYFAAGDMRVDMDGNCVLNVNDFVAYTAAFVVGCP